MFNAHFFYGDSTPERQRAVEVARIFGGSNRLYIIRAVFERGNVRTPLGHLGSVGMRKAYVKHKNFPGFGFKHLYIHKYINKGMYEEIEKCDGKVEMVEW